MSSWIARSIPGPADIPMRHHADRMERCVLRPDSALVQRVAEFDGIHAAGAAVENNNIGLHAAGIDFQPRNFRDALGKMPLVWRGLRAGARVESF